MGTLSAIAAFLSRAQASISLLVVGFVAAIWACLPSTATIQGANIGLDSPGRYVVLGLGVAAGISGIAHIVGVIGGGGDKLPVNTIEITGDARRIAGPDHPQYRLSGEVSPKKAGVKIWLLRERLDARGERFTPSRYTAPTDAEGRWEQTVHMWEGAFRLHAVVTTEPYDSFYEWYGRARAAALAIVQEHKPDSNLIPGWPPLASLPKGSVSARTARIDV